MEDLVALLIPIFICVVLPVSIVLILALSKNTSERLRANVLIKAIEANNNVDADKLVEALQQPAKEPKTARQILYNRLLCGCIFTFLGIAGFIFGCYVQASSHVSDATYLTFMVAGAFFAIGLGFLVTYFVSRKHVEKQDEK